MSTRSRPSRRRLVPALLFLLFAAGAAAWSLLPRRAAVGSGDGGELLDPTQHEPGQSKAGIDLLARFGSYDGRSHVPAVFRYVQVASRPSGSATTIDRSGEELAGSRRAPAGSVPGVDPVRGASETGSRPSAAGTGGPGVAGPGTSSPGTAGQVAIGGTPASGTPAAGTPVGSNAAAGERPAGVTDAQRPQGGSSVRPELEARPQATAPGAAEPLVRPLHRVSLVLITAGISRAVVDGKVVGVGDAILAGRVVGIVASGVQVESMRERLFFRLGGKASDGTDAVPSAPPGGDK